jgi:hypothetical protein
VNEPVDIGASRRDSTNWIELAQYSRILSFEAMLPSACSFIVDGSLSYVLVV